MGFLYSQVVFSLTIVQARLKVFGNGDDAWFVNAYHWRNRYDVAFASGIRMGYDISEIEAQRNLPLSRHRLSAGANIRRVQFEFAASRGITTPSYSQGGIEVR